jgi:hypothetical protein
VAFSARLISFLKSPIVVFIRPKRLCCEINCFQENGETSLPFRQTRFTNSATGLFSATTDLDTLIGTPMRLMISRYLSAKSLLKIIISSPTISYLVSQP